MCSECLTRGPVGPGVGMLSCYIASFAIVRVLHMHPTRYNVSITEAPVRGGVGNPPGLTVSVDPGHRAVWVSPDPGPTPGQPEAW